MLTPQSRRTGNAMERPNPKAGGSTFAQTNSGDSSHPRAMRETGQACCEDPGRSGTAGRGSQIACGGRPIDRLAGIVRPKKDAQRRASYLKGFGLSLLGQDELASLGL